MSGHTAAGEHVYGLDGTCNRCGAPRPAKASECDTYGGHVPGLDGTCNRCGTRTTAKEAKAHDKAEAAETYVAREAGDQGPAHISPEKPAAVEHKAKVVNKPRRSKGER